MKDSIEIVSKQERKLTKLVFIIGILMILSGIFTSIGSFFILVPGGIAVLVFKEKIASYLLELLNR